MKTLRSGLIVIFGILHTINGLHYSLNYKWKCTSTNKCIRQRDESVNIKEILYESQEVCRLVCGQYGALWPQPTGPTTLGNSLVKIGLHKIKFTYDNVPLSTLEFLETNANILLANLAKECSGTCTEDTDAQHILVEFYVSSPVMQLTWTTDESYTLDLFSTGNITNLHISAKTVFGARHGLETFSQLIAASNGPLTLFKSVLHLVSSASIKDSPVFVHRGLSVDTARNFIPIEDLKRTMDGMAASKMNVFHWHATDSQSFPLDMPRVPYLTRYGAYSSKHIYSQEDVAHIIKYGLHRGIRVLIEMDMPSHSGNGWQWGPEYELGDLAVCVNQQPWRSYCIQPPCGQLNPVNQNLYLILRKIFKDLMDVLPAGETLHMGGDEVFFACWNTTSEIVDFLASRGMGREQTDFLKLWGEFQSSALSIWDEEKSVNLKDLKIQDKIILWSSHLTHPDEIEKHLPSDRYIIQTWVPTTDDLPQQLLSKGYDLIMSTKNAWYFDHGFWGITTYYPWRTVYRNRIPRHKGVLGGEACVWTELIDEHSLDTRTWPRAAAVAERLWSDPGIDTAIVEPRFYRHRNRLVARGLSPEAVAPKYCVQNEGECL